MQNKSLLRISRFASLAFGSILILYILIANLTPLGASVFLTTHEFKGVSSLGPGERAMVKGEIQLQTADVAYFNIAMPFRFDRSRVRVVYRSDLAAEAVNVGYRNEERWHYYTKLINSPLLDTINWQKKGEGPYLYQEKLAYKTIGEFLGGPPKDSVIGTYDYDEAGLREHVRLPDYKPSKKEAVIDAPLRGKTTMYAYLDGEEFKMNFTKRDLNWYADPDVVKINVFKGKDKVFQATIDDDGNDTDNKKVGQPIDLEIKNPGPELPEAGVYKIVIDAPDDSVITKIETNLHKIAFEGPLYPVNNREVYGDLVAKTSPTILTTNANNLSFNTYHRALQTVDVGGQAVMLDQPQKTVTAPGATGAQPVNITMPLSDVVVNGIGYFSFTPEQFFTPTPYKILPIRTAEDLQKVDYVLTNYAGAPRQEGEWKVAEREFDLSDAVIQKGKLSWLISAPGLKENGRTIEIKSIEMTLTKKGWFE